MRRRNMQKHFRNLVFALFLGPILGMPVFTPGAASVAHAGEFQKSVEVELLLRIQEVKKNTGLAGAHVECTLGGRWYAFGGTQGQTDVKKSQESFSGVEGDNTKLKGKQVNLVVKGSVLVSGKEKFVVARVSRKGYAPAYFRIPCKSKRGLLRVYRELTLTPLTDHSLELNLKIQEAKGRTPLSGARVQYAHDGVWWPFGSSEDKPDAIRSKNSWSSPQGSNGKQVNYSVNGIVPTVPRQKKILFRVVCSGHESSYFKLSCVALKKNTSRYREVALTPCLTAIHWAFCEGKGETASDASRQANPGRIQGAEWVKVGGLTALSFDGQDDAVDCGRNPVYEFKQAVTVLLWIKPPENTTTLQGLIGRSWGNTFGFNTMGINGLEASIFIKQVGCVYLIKNGVLKPGQWNHVGFSYEDGRGRLYHNGSVVEDEITYVRGGFATTTVKARVLTPEIIDPVHREKYAPMYAIHAPSRQPLSIGYFHGVAHFKGLIRGVKIWNCTLSEEKVQEIWEKGKTK